MMIFPPLVGYSPAEARPNGPCINSSLEETKYSL
jgi:hypothetical protein